MHKDRSLPKIQNDVITGQRQNTSVTARSFHVTSKLTASQAFHDYKYETGMKMSKHIANVKNLTCRCKDLGNELSDIAKLPQSWRNCYKDFQRNIMSQRFGIIKVKLIKN